MAGRGARAAPPDRYTAICLLTHDPKIDDPGAGPRARGRMLLHRRARIEEDARQADRADAGEGFDETALARIHAPIGLDIGAVEPGRDRGVDHRRDRRRAAPEAASLGERRAMKFGAVPIDEADGVILAHAVRIDGLALKKGDVVTRAIAEECSREAGVESVVGGPSRGRRRRRGRSGRAPRERARGPQRAPGDALHRPGQSVRRGRGPRRVRPRGDRPGQRASTRRSPSPPCPRIAPSRTAT